MVGRRQQFRAQQAHDVRIAPMMAADAEQCVDEVHERMVLHGVSFIIEDVHPVLVEDRLHHRFVFFDRPRQNQDVFVAVAVLGDQFFDFIGHMENFRLFRFAAPDPDSFLLIGRQLE